MKAQEMTREQLIAELDTLHLQVRDLKEADLNRKLNEDALREGILEQIINALLSITAIRDPYTAGHQINVADLAGDIASALGMTKEQIGHVRTAALLHDIGKAILPTEILSKPGKLSSLEWSLVQGHAQASYDIVKTIEFVQPVAEIVLQHHERLNGSGYPRGLTGDSIAIEARIIAVADVIEAMASNRPYRPAYPLEMALDEIWENRGELYDPVVADVCLKAFE